MTTIASASPSHAAATRCLPQAVFILRTITTTALAALRYLQPKAGPLAAIVTKIPAYKYLATAGLAFLIGSWITRQVVFPSRYYTQSLQEVPNTAEKEFCMVEPNTEKDYQDPHNHLALLQRPSDSGALAQAGTLGSKVLGLSCYFTTTLGPIFDKEVFKAAAMGKDYTGNLWRALNSINERKCLTSGAIDTYSQWLMKKYPALKIAEGSTHEFSSITIPQIETGKTLYAIPVVLKGVRSHIVTFIYDAKSHTLEYYDSKGWNIRDCQNYPIDKKVEEPITLLDMYLNIMKAYSTAEKGAPNVWENQAAHQSDFYNCGIYVLDRIRKHADSGQGEEGIQWTHKRDLTGPSFDRANHAIRREILKSLLPELQSIEAEDLYSS